MLSKVITKSFWFFSFFLFLAVSIQAVQVGVGVADLTPPIGTPSAGYGARRDAGMEGIRDPLLATALVIDKDGKRVVFCSVDHLGFDTGMVDEVRAVLHSRKGFEGAELLLGSSHTHSGGGAYLNLTPVGPMLAGAFNPDVRKFYIDQAIEACVRAGQEMCQAKIGIGYGQTVGLTHFRSKWPEGVRSAETVTVMKITNLQDRPIAVLFNFACHPTVLGPDNRCFSADFVGEARTFLRGQLGEGVTPLFFNGAQGEVNPVQDKTSGDQCMIMGKAVADEVLRVWKTTDAREDFFVGTIVEGSPSFPVLPNPVGVKPSIDQYDSSLSAIAMSQNDVFIAIPGELSVVYETHLKEFAKELGWRLSILGLTNDAHGYLITPEAWDKGTQESMLCFGGREHGKFMVRLAEELLLSLKSKMDKGR